MRASMPAMSDYVEAHGTGTSLGDPIEVQALGAALCERRSKSEPLLIGSVKTNVGHLEAAAGIAGLIKVALSLVHREIPPHLHLQKKNPYVDWDSLPIEIPVQRTPWIARNETRIAGVSSFGISGTNAHVILEQAPEQIHEKTAADRPLHVLTLSAKNDDALRELVERYRLHLAADRGESLADIAFTANAGRAHFSHRLAAVAENTEELRAALGEWMDRGSARDIARGDVYETRSPELAFLFTGQGSQYEGMGRELYESAPVYRRAVDRCVAAVASEFERPLLDVMFGDGKKLEETRYTQPALFALEWGLAELWRSWGIEPSAVLGHSIGEYVAAAVAGVMSLEDGMKLVTLRGRLMQELGAGGAMLAVRASEERVRGAIEKHKDRVSLAAMNGPESVVISGWEDAIGGIEKELQGEGLVVKRLAVSHGFHSPQMDGMLEKWKRVLETVKFSEPRIRFVTDVTGEMAKAGELTGASYWVRQVREPVRFARGMKTLEESGIKDYVEIGPQAVLTGMGMESVKGTEARWYPSQRKQKGSEWKPLLESVQALYVAGAEIDWESFDREYARRRVLLPTYPFQRQRYWIDAAPNAIRAASADARDTWNRVVAAGLRQSRQAPFDIDVASFPAKWRALERLSVAYTITTLRQLGAFAEQGREFSLEEVLREFHIAPAHRQLMHRWLDRLARKGVLREKNQTYAAPAGLPDANLAQAWTEAEENFRDDSPALEYTRRCGERLAAVLTGKESALETLFPGGSFELAENVYQRSAASRYINPIAAEVVDAAARASAGALRVLEIGGGTGGTTAALLPRLPTGACEYCFTDVSDFFFEHASEKFAAFPFVRFGLLNIDADLANQGYAPGSFDVVVAANVLHAARDLDAAAERVRGLLSPGGVLVLVEATQDQAWFDITTGLIEGWQHFADEWRSDNPLLTAETWDTLLHRHDFADVRAFPEAGSIANAVGQHVIIAQAPSAAGESWRHAERQHRGCAECIRAGKRKTSRQNVKGGRRGRRAPPRRNRSGSPLGKGRPARGVRSR